MRKTVLDSINEILEKGINDNIRANNLQYSKKIMLLDAIYLLTKSWKEVTDSKIRNCFHRGGFVDPDLGKNNACDSVPFLISNDILESEFRR